MRIASWNVNGLRAVVRKGCFFEWVDDDDPDVVLLQETKAQPAQLPADLVDVPGWFTRYASATRKGYSGVAVWSRFEPDEWIAGLGDDAFDAEGRALSARFGDVVVTSAYFPNSREGGARLDYKLGFDAAIEGFCAAQRDKGRHVILGGDFNVAHQEIDLADPEKHGGQPGFLPEERDWFSRFLASGYTDAWRRQHPDERGVYTWWSLRTRARARGDGWRIDYFCVDEDYWPSVRTTDVLAGAGGSDHCPVTIDVANPK